MSRGLGDVYKRQPHASPAMRTTLQARIREIEAELGMSGKK